jgi:hypothetical protein
MSEAEWIARRILAMLNVSRKAGQLQYASDQRDRWARIGKVTETPFEPDAWPSPAEYLLNQ